MLDSDQRSTVVKAKQRLLAVLAFLGAIGDLAEARAREYADARFDPEAGPVHKAANVGTVITVVAIAVVSIVGILIYAEVESSLGTPADQNLADAQSNVTSGFGDAMGLVPVILIVLLAALVIGVVQTLRA